MSSVIDYEECTQCGGFYYIDHNYRTGNEYGICHNCGKSHSVSLLRSENDELITDDNGNIKYERAEKQGFGVFMYMTTNGFGQLSAFSELPSAEEINGLLLQMNDENADYQNSYLCVWNADLKELTTIFGSPLKYGDEIETIPEYSDKVEEWPETVFDENELPF